MIVVAGIVLLGALYVGAKVVTRSTIPTAPSTYQGSNNPGSAMQEDPSVVAEDAKDDQSLNVISAEDADTASLSDTSGL